MESSKVLEHMRPIDRPRRRPTLPALRDLMTTGAEVWHPMPTSAKRSPPPKRRQRRRGGWPSTCNENRPAAVSPHRVRATAGYGAPARPVPSSTETRAASIRSCSMHHRRMADTTPPSWPVAKKSGSVAARQQDGLGHAGLLFGQPGPAEEESVRLRLPVPEARAGARAACTATQAVACSRPGRAHPPDGTAYRPPPRCCSRARRGGRQLCKRRTRCTSLRSPPR